MRPFIVPALSLSLLVAAADPPSAETREPESANIFLRRIYAPYLAGDMSLAPTGKAAPTLFDQRLTALIRQDQRNAHSQVGALDGDPICDCQDLEGLQSLTVDVRPLGTDRATAAVSFTNGTRAVSLTYNLTLTREGWRIADIGSADVPSLVAYLEKANRAK